MPIVRPFRGIRYDLDVAGPIETLVAPPYDVISKADQDKLYDSSPRNVVRVDLSREADRYGAAAKLWSEWQKEGILARDAEPSIYAYSQLYTLPSGVIEERWGFFARLRLEEFSSGKVLPHEKTLPKAKADRLALQHACKANLSPIFGIYSKPGMSAAKILAPAVGRAPEAEVADAFGVRHRMWRVTDAKIIGELETALADRSIYIADGHHRYETALRYRRDLQEETGRRSGDEPFDHVLAFVCNVEEPGLTVLPTHRLIRKIAVPGVDLLGKLRGLFRVEEPKGGDLVAALRAVGPGERRLGLVLHEPRTKLVLIAKDGDHDAKLSGSTALRRLDVTLLHELVLGPVLDVDPHHDGESGQLVYVKDDAEAALRVESGEFAVGFLMNSTRVDEVRTVCEAGEVMPEKSTYFYPKLLTGLVFLPLDDATL